MVTGELALDESGKILGLRVDALHQMGSHVFERRHRRAAIRACKLAPGVYNIPAVHASAKAVLTNTTPMAPYRGAGRPEATFLIEQLHRTGGTRHRHRSDRNQAAQFHSGRRHAAQDRASGMTYDSGDFMHVMDECLKLADWNGFAKRAAASKKNGKLRGRGVGYFLEEAAVFNDRMVLRFDPSGTADHRRRHPFARPGPSDRLCADGA